LRLKVHLHCGRDQRNEEIRQEDCPAGTFGAELIASWRSDSLLEFIPILAHRSPPSAIPVGTLTLVVALGLYCSVSARCIVSIIPQLPSADQ
jgi:hypothetical protein